MHDIRGVLRQCKLTTSMRVIGAEVGADGRYDLAMLGTGLPSARWPNGVSCSASPVMARYANPRTGCCLLE